MVDLAAHAVTGPLTSGNEATALAKRPNHYAVCWAVRTTCNTMTPALTAFALEQRHAGAG